MLTEFFFWFASIIDTVNNYIQFFLVLFTIIATLLYFMLPYIRPLRVLTSDLGVGIRETMRVLWLCYKNPRKYIRLYIELALIKTGGIHQDKKWWHEFRTTFKKFLDDNEHSNTYAAGVNTPFDLARTEFNEKVKQYFDYFKQGKIATRFGIPQDTPASFITEIEIEEGYIVPITFITGLNDRYDEDWVKILRNFFTAFDNTTAPETAILPEELYFTYNWLMWGPSYQNKYDKDKYKLIQYGFGDESNSVNVILDHSERSTELWEMFCHEAEMSDEKKFGHNSVLRGRIVDTSCYYRHMYDKIDLKSVPFLKRLSAPELGIPFLVELTDYQIKKSRKAENYFFSAYLWIMFGLTDEEDPGFTPRKSVTFFEHANLADVHNYNFLATSLIDKCFNHFTYIASHPVYNKRSYYFCLSMNSFIEKLFLEKLEEMKQSEYGHWYSNNLSTHTPFSISEILDTFDNYFVMQADEVNIIEIEPLNKEHIRLLCNYYAEVYRDIFCKQSARLNLDHMLALLQRKDAEFSFHISLALNSANEVLGGVTSFYFPALHCGLIDSVAVHENHRNDGIGKNLIHTAVQQMRTDALRFKGGKLGFVLSAIPCDCYKNKSTGHYRFWDNYGFVRTEINNETDSLQWALYPLKGSSAVVPDTAQLKNTIEKMRIEIGKHKI